MKRFLFEVPRSKFYNKAKHFKFTINLIATIFKKCRFT